MRLLFDQMLSYKLPLILADLYPYSTHVHRANLTDASDSEIWEYARTYDYIVTSEDKDFVSLSRNRGFPPKLIKVDIGNASNE